MRCKLFAGFLANILLLIVNSTGFAQTYNYLHNGSEMKLSVNGDQVQIFYQKPRPGLEGVGVRPGTLLVNGRIQDGYFDGQARIFNANCGEVDYYVYGDLHPGRDFKLKGAAPVVSNVSCRIVNNTYDGSNANLNFVRISSGPAPQPPVAKGTCVTGVNSFLNVRTRPSSAAGKVGFLTANSCGIEKIGSCNSGWCLIRQNKIIGWVSSQYLK